MKNPFNLIELVWWTHSRRKQSLKSMLDALGTRLKLLRKQSIKSMANAHSKREIEITKEEMEA